MIDMQDLTKFPLLKIRVKAHLIDSITFILGRHFGDMLSLDPRRFLVLKSPVQREPIPYRAYGIIELVPARKHCEVM